MTVAEALAFVEQHGIVLEAARRGDIPSLADAIAGEPIRGNWWGHPAGRAIFTITRAVRESPQILVCRLVDGKISFVHERLWPSLARLADRFPHGRLDRLREIHTEHGAHRVEEIPFPDWLDAATVAAGERLSISAAQALLRPLLPDSTGIR